MSDWIDQYSAALDERDAREQAHKAYIDAYTRLADRTAASAAQEATLPPAPSSPKQPSTSKLPARTTTPVRGKTASPAPQEDLLINDTLSRLRADLATTQKARSVLQSEVSTLTSSLKDLETQHRTSTAQIAQLTRQRTDVERRLRDRDEELRGKTKLAEDAQDEMVALGLQLNMAEEKSRKLEKENKDLVERWMKRMGEEAERVNRESKWD